MTESGSYQELPEAIRKRMKYVGVLAGLDGPMQFHAREIVLEANGARLRDAILEIKKEILWPDGHRSTETRQVHYPEFVVLGFTMTARPIHDAEAEQLAQAGEVLPGQAN